MISVCSLEYSCPLDWINIHEVNLGSWLFLLLLPQSQQGDTGDLDNLESDTGDITLSLTSSTETGKQDFVVLVDKVQTTVIGHESGNLLTVLDQLDSDTLSDGRVGLLGLNTNLFQHNTLGVGRTTEWRRLEGSSQQSGLVSLVSPSVVTTVNSQFSSRVKTSWFTTTHFVCEM